MLFVISYFYTMINLYTNIGTVSRVIETIRHRRNFDIDYNNNLYLHGIIIDEELEAISSSKLIK